MDLISSAISNWLSLFGDDGIIPWIITTLYLFGGISAYYYARRFKTQASISYNRNEPVFWYLVCAFLLFLAFNKQLDLQTLLSAIGRESAMQNNWYSIRRTYQMWFIGAVILSSTGLLAIAFYTLRDTIKKNRLALIGIFILVIFIQIRAVSFHHLDRMLEFQLVGVGLHWLLEIVGISLILTSIYLNLKKTSDGNSI